jgi:hypothetical protein
VIFLQQTGCPHMQLLSRRGAGGQPGPAADPSEPPFRVATIHILDFRLFSLENCENKASLGALDHALILAVPPQNRAA